MDVLRIERPAPEPALSYAETAPTGGRAKQDTSRWPVKALAGRVARLSIRMGFFLQFFLGLFLLLLPYPGPLAQLVELRTFNP